MSQPSTQTLPFEGLLNQQRAKIAGCKSFLVETRARLSNERRQKNFLWRPVIAIKAIGFASACELNILRLNVVCGLIHIIRWTVLAVGVGLAAVVAIAIISMVIAFFSSDPGSNHSDYQPIGLSRYDSSPAVESHQQKPNDKSFWEGDTARMIGDAASDPQVQAGAMQLLKWALSGDSDSSGGPVQVDSYTDKNGRYVPEHTRSLPER
jgi:hypothetical protein